MSAPKTSADWPPVTMYGIDFRKELHVMYEAVTALGHWKRLKEDPGEGGFMWSSEQFVKDIFSHPKVEECGHSGATQAVCLRHMQFIAVHGFEKFYAKFSRA